jgi:Tat protein secretion system quality control protein TatD with DNase activity
VLKIPLERLLLETDAPDGKPHSMGDLEMDLADPSPDSARKLNHPANIRFAFLAHCNIAPFV